MQFITDLSSPTLLLDYKLCKCRGCSFYFLSHPQRTTRYPFGNNIYGWRSLSKVITITVYFFSIHSPLFPFSALYHGGLNRANYISQASGYIQPVGGPGKRLERGKTMYFSHAHSFSLSLSLIFSQ